MIETKSAGGVVVNPRGEILVVSQRGAAWSLPKGHLERDDKNLLAAARREITEEAGITKLKYIKYLGQYQRFKEQSLRYGGAELKTISMFLFITEEDVLDPQDADNPEARWVRREAVPELLFYKEDKDFFIRIMPRLPE